MPKTCELCGAADTDPTSLAVYGDDAPTEPHASLMVCPTCIERPHADVLANAPKIRITPAQIRALRN